MFKKIDKYLIRQFIPPYITAFLIVEFVLILQFLWKYIDDIMGKGTGFLTLSELIFYLSFTLFPTALPWAILMASVMVLGNLAERYELSSMKSAGISLMRIIRSLTLVAIGTTLFSLLCSESLIPYFNLKFQARFYDIRRQKPVMSLEQGVFNDDFTGYTIRIGRKEADDRTIHDVLIYDNFGTGGGRFNMIFAKKGEMYSTSDKRFMIMELYEGYQSQEIQDNKNPRRTPFLRTKFRHWTKVFDLAQFSSGKSDEDIFKDNLRVLGISRLWNSIDSTNLRVRERQMGLKAQVMTYFSPTKMTARERRNQYMIDSLRQEIAIPGYIPLVDGVPRTKPSIGTNPVLPKGAIPHYKTRPDMLAETQPTKQLHHWSEIRNLPAIERAALYRAAETNAKSAKNTIESTRRSIKTIEESKGEAIFELHTKLSLAAVCFLFLFIGAPLGAIIQKGGFGYPLLLAILFFAMYLVLSIWFKNMAKTQTMMPILAAWLPFLLYVPLCFVLTYRALNDYKIANFDTYVKRIIGVVSRILPRKWLTQ